MTDMFIKTSLTGTKAEGWIKDAGTWHKLGGAGLTGLGGWADITAVTGSPKRHAYTDAGGTDWVAFEWHGDGSVTTTEGLVDVLILSGGVADPTASTSYFGGGGSAIAGTLAFPAGTQTVEVGVGGTNHSDWPNWVGKRSVCGPYDTGMETRASIPQGYSNMTYPGNGVYVQGKTYNILGTPEHFGDSHSRAPRANRGDGGVKNGTAVGSSGVVIIRVPKASVTATTGWV